jgi:CxxC motif-containing protein (DUF1111 family)
MGQHRIGVGEYFGQDKATNQPSNMKNISKFALPTGLGASLCIIAFAQLADDQPNLSAESQPTQFGDPLRGLTEDQLAAFDGGLEDFQEVETPESGLGPIFNNVSCVACHSAPAVGGSSAILETRFGRFMNGHFDPLIELGGSLLQQSAIDPACQEFVPPEANVTAQRQTTPLFGLGLIEAIPDGAILQNADSRKPDGITGRASIVQDVASGERRVGRFGWKAQQATLLAFAADAYLNEMGITSRLFPQENAPNGDLNLLAHCDAIADPEDEVDPETGKADIDAFADFMRFLAPPPQLSLTTSASSGQTLFKQIGCATCHTPVMQTGKNSVEALDRKPVRLFSDLLLHNMGTLGDGIAQGTATPREMRTAPLWGLRASAPYLHDGRAETVNAAIRAHDGEATAPRDRFIRLSPTQRQQILDFLDSI